MPRKDEGMLKAEYLGQLDSNPNQTTTTKEQNKTPAQHHVQRT